MRWLQESSILHTSTKFLVLKGFIIVSNFSFIAILCHNPVVRLIFSVQRQNRSDVYSTETVDEAFQIFLAAGTRLGF